MFFVEFFFLHLWRCPFWGWDFGRPKTPSFLLVLDQLLVLQDQMPFDLVFYY